MSRKKTSAKRTGKSPARSKLGITKTSVRDLTTDTRRTKSVRGGALRSLRTSTHQPPD
jgi:hypothetical protein